MKSKNCFELKSQKQFESNKPNVLGFCSTFLKENEQKVSGLHSCIFGNRKFINYIFQLHFTFIKISHKKKSSKTPEEIFYYLTLQEFLMLHCEILRRNMRFLWEKNLDTYLTIFNLF